jgi:hypothetical protein
MLFLQLLLGEVAEVLIQQVTMRWAVAEVLEPSFGEWCLLHQKLSLELVELVPQEVHLDIQPFLLREDRLLA